MKLTLLAGLGCALLLLAVADAQFYGGYGQRYGRSYGRYDDYGRYSRFNRGRGLRRLAAAGLILGTGVLLGYAFGRGKRSADGILVEDLRSPEELTEQQVFALLGRLRDGRCLEVWVCDMFTRDESELSDEELSVADLFSGGEQAAELEEPEASVRAIYQAAAERGVEAGGDRAACMIPSCHTRPELVAGALQTMASVRA